MKIISLSASLLLLFSLSAPAQEPGSQAIQILLQKNSALRAEDLKIKSITPGQGRQIVRVQQVYKNLPVEGNEAVVGLGNDGRLLYVESKLADLNSQTVAAPGARIQDALAALRFKNELADLIERNPAIVVDTSDGQAASSELVKAAAQALRKNKMEVQAPFWKISVRHENLQPIFRAQLVQVGTLRVMSDMKISAAAKDLGHILSESAVGHQIADVTIYDGALNPLVPVTSKGMKVLENGQPVGPLWRRAFISDDARQANANLNTTLAFYQTQFGRDSYDGQGTAIDAIVRIGKIPVDILGLRQNAAWVAPLKLFAFGGGDPKGLNNFTQALDVIAHEFTHAVIETTSQLAYEGESGALNEHLADVFGEMIQTLSGKGAAGNEMLIGEDVLTPDLKAAFQKKTGRELRGLRDMLHPERGLEKQPGSVAETPAEYGAGCSPQRENDNCGVHLMNGIPNHLAALIVQKLGWSRVEKVFYNTMTGRLTSHATFRDYAHALLDECALQLSAGECQTVSDAVSAVGISL